MSGGFNFQVLQFFAIEFWNEFSLSILFTCTTGEFESWARASRMLTLVFRCCPDPIPPTYRCRQPRAKEWPVLLITSLADFRLQS